MLIISLLHVAVDVTVSAGLPSVCVSNLQNSPVLVFWVFFLKENGCCLNLTINYCSCGSRLSPNDPPHSAIMTPHCLSVANCENSTLSCCSVKHQLRLRTKTSRDGPQRTQILSHDIYIYTHTLIEVHTPSVIIYTLCTQRQS